MFDLQVPFFNPLWRRVSIVGITLGWAVFEFLTGALAWAVLFGAIGVFCFYQFFVVWDPKEDGE